MPVLTRTSPAIRRGPAWLLSVLSVAVLLCMLACALPGAAHGTDLPAVQAPGGALLPDDVAMDAPPAAGETPAGGGRRDMTVFFSIGAVLDVLLVAGFLVWAVRQWRKTGKQE